MKSKSTIIRTALFAIISLTIINCSIFSSDHFVGTWIQVADLSSNPLKVTDTPITLRISKHDLFYLVEGSGDNGSTFSPYPDQSGKYELSDDKKSLISVAFGDKFSILYREDADALHEIAWWGYFKKK